MPQCVEKLLESSRHVHTHTRTHTHTHDLSQRVEDVRDHMAFVLDGLRRGQLQWTPQLVPLLLRSDGKVPKGFENFLPKGDKVA